MSSKNNGVGSTTPANPSVVLNDIIANGAIVTVTAADGTKKEVKAEANTLMVLKELISERQAWEDNAYRTSNEQLYALLQRIYNFYRSISGKENELKKEQLLNFCAAQGYRFTPSSHLITKVVRCIFEDKAMDRRRVSTYSLVLRSAHKQVLDGVLRADAVAEFVAKRGGVEQVRLAKSLSALTPKQKAQAASEMEATTIAVVSSEALSAVSVTGKVNKHAVLLAVQKADGSFAIKSLLYSDGVVNAALAAFYAKQKALQDEAEAKAEATDSDNLQADAVAAAVQDAGYALAA